MTCAHHAWSLPIPRCWLSHGGKPFLSVFLLEPHPRHTREQVQCGEATGSPGHWLLSLSAPSISTRDQCIHVAPVHSCLLMQLWLLYRAHTRLQLRKSQDPARGPQSQWPLLAILTVWGGCVLCLEQKRGTADNHLGVWPQQLSLCLAILVLPQQETLQGGRVTL